jgi:hypothetical protein
LSLAIPKTNFLKLADAVMKKQLGNSDPGLLALLAFGWEYPTILNKKNKVKPHEAKDRESIENYLEGFVAAYSRGKSCVLSLKAMTTMPDPAVDVVLEAFANHKAARKVMESHRLGMAAENIIGDLLEAYLAIALATSGWICCYGEILRAVDFFHPRNPGVRLLQIKNRDNSENSSSSEIRATLKKAGCPVDIEIWFRTFSRTGETNWSSLPGNTRGELASEQEFLKFVRGYPKRTRTRD